MKTGFFWCVAMCVGLGLLVTGCAWGVVRDAETGEGVEGASVIWVDSGGAAGAIVTGDSGLYRFDATLGEPIPARGPATFIVLAPGYQTLVTTRDVEYDDNAVNIWEIQSFALTRIATPTAVPTSSPVPTATPVPSATPVPTATPVLSATPVSSATPVLTASPTLAPKATATPVPTATGIS